MKKSKKQSKKSSKQKSGRACSVCQKPGHNRRTCGR